MYSISLWIFLIVAEIAYGMVVNSFNGLVVGPGQLNGIGGDIYAVNAFNGPRASRPTMSRSSSGLPVQASSSTIINSFQGNIVGPNSLQNNAGISLVPTRIASTSNYSRQIDQWDLFRRRMRIWAAQIREAYRLYYSLYPYAYIYRNYS